MKHMVYIQQNKDNFIEVEDLFGKAKKFRNLADIWDYKDDLYGCDTVILQPQYLTTDMIKFIIDKKVECLYLEDRFLKSYFDTDEDKYETLADLSFLSKLLHLKCLKIDAYSFFLNPKPIMDISDYTPMEQLNRLEYIEIPDNGDLPIYVDIDFSKLKNLKYVNLQYPKSNKTIYECSNIKTIETRYYETDLTYIYKWDKLSYFSAYCDNLVSFKGIEQFLSLDTIKVEVTSKFKTFKGIDSKNIKKFMIYTEAKNTVDTLDGMSGLKQVELIALNGFKKLKSIGDIYKCIYIKELRFENCNIPKDIEKIVNLKNLEYLIMDNCKVASISFIKDILTLKSISLGGNTKIEDGNLSFLKQLNKNGIEIYFTDKKHYDLKMKDITNKKI